MNKRRKKSPPTSQSASAAPQLRGRLSVELASRSALTEAGADLLEQIAISGSLSEAARQLHYSYRWAWLLVDSMNRTWKHPLVTTSTGGKKGGGARLTAQGKTLLAAYRHLQLQLEHFLDLQSAPFLSSINNPEA